LSQPPLYANVLARIGVERSKLLSENKLRTLAETRSLAEFTAQLQDTSYREQTTAIQPPLSSSKLERAFRENQILSYIKVARNSPKEVAGLLRLYVAKFEVDNVKTLIKTTNAKLTKDQKAGRIYFSAEDFLKKRSIFEEALLTADISGVVAAFKGTMHDAPLRSGMGGYEEDGSTACFDVLLDREYYEQLYDAYQKLPTQEKAHARFFVGTENDGFVLSTVLRGKNLGYDHDWLRTAVPRAKFHVRQDDLESMVVAEDFDSALKTAQETRYGKFFVKAQTNEETIANAEQSFRKSLFEHAKSTRFAEIFNVGLPLVFVTQKNVEVDNLVVACSGVEAGLAPEEIVGRLLL
jgi:V/A-type H+/Na+-transporting ATPase subunit C